MGTARKSSDFTKSVPGPFGPALIGALLRLPWETVRRRMLERLHERGFDDLEIAHLNLFLFPGPQGLKPSELAARLGASKQSVNHVLGQMERFGYLERRDDRDDLRSTRIHLTSRGKLVVTTIREAVMEVEGEWRQKLGSQRLELLRQMLIELSEAGPEPPGPAS